MNLEQVDGTDSNYVDGKDYLFRAQLNVTGNYSYYFEFRNPINGDKTTDIHYIDVTKPRESSPRPGSGATVAALLLMAIVVCAATASHRRPPRCDAR